MSFIYVYTVLVLFCKALNHHKIDQTQDRLHIQKRILKLISCTVVKILNPKTT